MDYRDALVQTVSYIENHLSDDIKVEEVAKAAGYSYYHLNRQFAAILGEGIGGYIRKRRLAEAAKHLLYYSDEKIIDVAMESSFESAEAFSRTFKNVYGVSPQAYRQNRLDILLSRKYPLDSGRIEHLSRNVTVHPRIVELPEIKAVGLRGEASMQINREIIKLWEKANRLFLHLPNRIPNGRAFGISEFCDGNTLHTMTTEIMFPVVAAAEVSSFAGIPEEFARKIIPGGRYAVFTHRGTLTRLMQSFDYIWGTWSLQLKMKSGEAIDDAREAFEMYDARFLGYDHPDSEVDLYIPMK
ncbi:AraC family transcriptional regulator [Lactovum odontotermitis]